MIECGFFCVMSVVVFITGISIATILSSLSEYQKDYIVGFFGCIIILLISINFICLFLVNLFFAMSDVGLRCCFFLFWYVILLITI